ncbi:MAG: hypothetical protein EXS16_18440 [Gemmataceae bacterium]|nr:hypothetical protein [Gemmataceae bacterium]
MSPRRVERFYRTREWHRPSPRRRARAKCVPPRCPQARRARRGEGQANQKGCRQLSRRSSLVLHGLNIARH